MVHSDHSPTPRHHWERQKMLTSTAHQSLNKTKYSNKAKISIKWESQSVRESKGERERESEQNTNPRALLYLCDYLAKPTMAHGGYSKRKVKPKPKSVSLKNRIRYQSTACSGRYFSLADQWPWIGGGGDRRELICFNTK